MEILIRHQSGSIVELTLNRPEKRNALNTELVNALKSQLMQLQYDEAVRVIIISGNGEAFCAGADLAYLQQLQSFSYEENLEDSLGLAELFRLIYLHPKLIIARVEGSALAGGCGLAAVCDLCYATKESKFGYTEVKIGFIPAIVSYFLVRKIGEAKARELLLTGKIIEAPEALDRGLITGIMDAEEIKIKVSQIAEKLARETSPSSIALTKKLLAGIQHLSIDDALQLAAESNAQARGTDDCKKGIAAFLNKEKLSW
jgi:methylglutaconyl-CoA hydratase